QRERAAAEAAAAAAAAAVAADAGAGGAVPAGIPDLGGLQPGHQRGPAAAVAAAAAAAPPAVDLGEALGEVLRGHVLELVGEQLHAAARAVDARDPLLDLVEVGRLRRDDQDRVGAFQRHEAEHARHRRIAALAEHLLQVGHHLRRAPGQDRKSTRLNSSHVKISYA